MCEDYVLRDIGITDHQEQTETIPFLEPWTEEGWRGAEYEIPRGGGLERELRGRSAAAAERITGKWALKIVINA